jgi:hypothetical protein
MLRAAYSRLPVVRVGRGNTKGFVPLDNPVFIGGSNLTATKARLLLMACLMRFGALPPAADPDNPTSAESAVVGEKVAAYHAVFNTHSEVSWNFANSICLSTSDIVGVRGYRRSQPLSFIIASSGRLRVSAGEGCSRSDIRRAWVFRRL